MKTIRRALISVSDKTGLAPFAKALKKLKVEILSTGGTLRALEAAGVSAGPVEKFTGFPEMLDGRVKTLHPKIHGGLLFRRDKKTHVAEAKKHGIEPIDLVVVNLYPFEKVTSQKETDFETAVENIDIGGPSMLRSAAKNFDAVAVICDPGDYPLVLEELEKHQGKISGQLRRQLALKVFKRTAAYDAAIAAYLEKEVSETGEAKEQGLPQLLDPLYEKSLDLRYGENPHQRAAFYMNKKTGGRLHYEQLHGKELSYNNLLDIEAAIDMMREFEEPAAGIIKHNNPCGIAENKSLTTALEKAIECDMMSAFGGIIGLNRPCDFETAEMAFSKLNFFEVFVAPSFAPKALDFLKARKNLRLIATGELGDGGPYDLRFMKSGVLLQDRDRPLRLRIKEFKKNLKVVTKTTVTPEEIEDLIFAFKCVKVVKSNAIVITHGRQTVGIGAGQMSRVDSVEIACRKASYLTEGGMLASDAFFPMPDSIEVAAEHKIKAIIQPGGSIRDSDVIAACDKLGIAMVLTGERHFRH